MQILLCTVKYKNCFSDINVSLSALAIIPAMHAMITIILNKIESEISSFLFLNILLSLFFNVFLYKTKIKQ